MHTLLSLKSLSKTCLEFSLYTRKSRSETLILNGLCRYVFRLVEPIFQSIEPGIFQILLSAACIFLNLDLYHLEHCLVIPIDSRIYIKTNLCLRFANCSKLLEPNRSLTPLGSLTQFFCFLRALLLLL